MIREADLIGRVADDLDINEGRHCRALTSITGVGKGLADERERSTCVSHDRVPVF
jgi:hypothetical protein